MTYGLTSLRCSSPASGLTRWCVTSTNWGQDTTGNSPSEILHSASVFTTAPRNPVTRGTPCTKLLITTVEKVINFWFSTEWIMSEVAEVAMDIFRLKAVIIYGGNGGAKCLYKYQSFKESTLNSWGSSVSSSAQLAQKLILLYNTV